MIRDNPAGIHVPKVDGSALMLAERIGKRLKQMPVDLPEWTLWQYKSLNMQRGILHCGCRVKEAGLERDPRLRPAPRR